MERETRITTQKGKELLLVLVGLGFTVGSLFFILSGQFLFTLFGLFSMLFFGAATVARLKIIFSQRPLLRITHNGLYDYSTVCSTDDRLIRWEEIQSIRVKRVFTQRILVIRVFDVVAIDQDLSWLKQLGLRINRLFFSGDYFLNVAEAKGMTAEAISEEMLAYWKESNRERRE